MDPTICGRGYRANRVKSDIAGPFKERISNAFAKILLYRVISYTSFTTMRFASVCPTDKA